jgi:hypothetical protein
MLNEPLDDPTIQALSSSFQFWLTFKPGDHLFHQDYDIPSVCSVRDEVAPYAIYAVFTEGKVRAKTYRSLLRVTALPNRS